MTTINERLEAIRTATGGCRAAALADLGSAIALAVSAEPPLPRERLDGLCTVAARVLGPPNRRPARRASLWTNSEIVHFLASPTESDECLICICTAEVDADAIEAAAAGLFSGQVADERG